MDLSHILNDRESGSVALLNRLVGMLEEELEGTGLDMEAFRSWWDVMHSWPSSSRQGNRTSDLS